MYRITLTHPVANHAARVAFLVSGENKVNALHEVLYGDYNPSLYPSANHQANFWRIALVFRRSCGKRNKKIILLFNKETRSKL
jgi:6-phosphogluconolactonase/glucosamine-6-phosphate isomerase/deaminase